MTDRIDPGPGWRLLDSCPIIMRGDEFHSNDGWFPSLLQPGLRGVEGMVYRRRTKESSTKAIATRATVRGVFPDGAITSHSIECKTGLAPEMMASASERWELANRHLSESGAKYIMLEIQREGEP